MKMKADISLSFFKVCPCLQKSSAFTPFNKHNGVHSLLTNKTKHNKNATIFLSLLWLPANITLKLLSKWSSNLYTQHLNAADEGVFHTDWVGTWWNFWCYNQQFKYFKQISIALDDNMAVKFHLGWMRLTFQWSSNIWSIVYYIAVAFILHICMYISYLNATYVRLVKIKKQNSTT